MKTIHKKMTTTAVVSFGVGVLAILPIVQSQNGYTAGFIIIPLMCLIGLGTLILLIAGLVTITGEIGPLLILAAFLLPSGFIGAGLTSSYLELGAYKEQPMQPIIPQIANKVIFKKDATHDEVQAFWREVLAEPKGETGHMSRPGVQAVSSNPDENGHEVVTFAFFENATEEQKADIRRRINGYEPVLEFLENVDTTPKLPEIKSDSSNKSRETKPREPNTYTIKK